MCTGPLLVLVVAAALPDTPFPSVAGIQATMALSDPPATRQRRADELCDAAIVEELDRSGYLGAASRQEQTRQTGASVCGAE